MDDRYPEAVNERDVVVVGVDGDSEVKVVGGGAVVIDAEVEGR